MASSFWGEFVRLTSKNTFFEVSLWRGWLASREVAYFHFYYTLPPRLPASDWRVHGPPPFWSISMWALAPTRSSLLASEAGRWQTFSFTRAVP